MSGPARHHTAPPLAPAPEEAPAPAEGAAEIITFGCRLNAYESEVMRGLAAKAGARTEAGAEAESEAGAPAMVIVNTCAVTAEAERQARQAIRRARRRHPKARIVVTGCAAQIDPAAFARMDEVDLVLGNAEKLMARSYAPEGHKTEGHKTEGRPEGGAGEADMTAKIRVGDIAAARETAGHLIQGFIGRARAFLEVQQGCDHRCTFCIIPFGRGPNRSVPLDRIVAQARELTANGYGEIVLTGVDIASWGADMPGRPRLGDVVHRLLTLVPEIRRLRLSSLDPAAVDDALLRLMAEEERLMPHLHLSLQAGDDMVLKRMKRRHSRAQAVALTERLRRLRPDIVFGADLIAGFPTETEAMFRNSLDLVADCGLTWLHVFPYSPRPGTPAARMPQLPPAERKDRAARLRARGMAARDAYLASRVGGCASVLLETPVQGHDAHFAPVRLEDADAPGAPGSIVAVRLTAAGGGELVGHAAP